MSTSTSTKIDIAEFKRGYPVLLVCIIGVITSAAVSPLYTFGPLVKPLQDAFGWARGEVQTTITFFFIGLVISSPVAAWLIARLGLRRSAIFSALCLALGYAALSLVKQSIWGLYIGYMLLPVIGAGTQMVIWTQLISLWFFKNRGLALALVLTGTGLCAMTVTPLVARVVEFAGWQQAYWFLASLSLVITLPVALFWMPNQGPAATPVSASAPTTHAHRPRGMSYREAFATKHFWLITFGLSFTVIGILGMITNAVPLMRDNGVPATTAASIFGSVGAALVFGRTVAGYLIDRLWAPGVAFATLTLPALGCVIFGVEHTNTTLLVIAAMLVGVGAGAEFDFASFLVARYFGLQSYSRIFSVFYSISSLFTCVTPFFLGRLYDMTGSYQAMLWVCGICFLIGPTLLLLLGPYPPLEQTHDQQTI